MLQSIRERTHGWFAWILFSMISIMFILWGVQGYIDSSVSDVAATVNGTDIHQSELHSAYERLRSQQQFQLGSNAISPDMETQLKQQALQELIVNNLLGQSAAALGLRFSLSQAIANIRLMPTFQVNDQFSMERFKAILARLSYSEQQFISNLQSGMLINQLRIGFINSAFALPSEVDSVLKLIKQRRDIQYLIIPRKGLSANVEVPEQEILAYYNQHQKDYEMPERVSIQYLELAQAQNNSNPEQLFADQSEKLANLTFANPSSLEPAAKALNLKIVKTGFFTKAGAKERVLANPKVIAAAFSNDVLKQGNNSNLIELDPQHVVVLRVNAHQAAGVQPLGDVRTAIIAKLHAQKSAQAAAEVSQKIVAELASGKNIQSLMQQYQLAWVTKNNVGRYDNAVPGHILMRAFQLPVSTDKSIAAGSVALASGDYAVVMTKKIYEPDARISPREKRAFKEQLEHLYGQLDYGLYVDSVFKKAKIKIKPAAAD